MVIGRDREENAKLQQIDNPKFIHIETVGVPGPHVLLSKNADAADRDLALRGLLTYCKTSPEEAYALDVNGETVTAFPLASRAEAAKYSIL